jgi:AraC-like DNA-binding protein
MPIYMDVHYIPGVGALDVAEAHHKDMRLQEEYHCKCMTYWVDEARGNVFCLIDAPDSSMVEEMHRNAHGLIPHKIIEVKNELVESFLGRIHDPEKAETSGTGLKVFSEAAFRVLLVSETTDPVLLRHGLGPARAKELLEKQGSIVRRGIAVHGGREVEHAGHGFIASFSSAGGAVACAREAQKDMPHTDRQLTGLRIGVTAGEPVAKSDRLFGDALQLARYLCTVNRDGRVVIGSGVKELLARDLFQTGPDEFLALAPADEAMLVALFHTLEENWQDGGFGVDEFCRAMSMSKSQLYRKTIGLWSLSPNLLLKEFRLGKAKELLKRQSFNVAQTTFDSGFSSPSYFTKCFKKKFGLLPATYQDSLV